MKYIKEYENLYSITEDGVVYSHLKGIWLKKIRQKTGYLTVTLFKEKRGKMFQIHRLVADAYLENVENKPMVNHIDLNKENNNISNLEWVTAKENINHAILNGLMCGENNGNSKLTSEIVKQIREKYKFRKYTYGMLSKEYGVGKTYVGRIINRTVWKSC